MFKNKNSKNNPIMGRCTPNIWHTRQREPSLQRAQLFQKRHTSARQQSGLHTSSGERSNTFVQIRCDIFSEISMPFKQNLKILIGGQGGGSIGGPCYMLLTPLGLVRPKFFAISHPFRFFPKFFCYMSFFNFFPIFF